ncbi:helix-turn-helix domain-containing protein [Burkholderia sp. Cy-647]|uniref:helix-turn-helix domain-containing protein n=1 Tax=Burkholderia sp. Cy-647 TaxID=2608328 RepID=UPI0014225E99|nr:helix-turn-helix domain-containing protein [Burkholderia sp. Tr-860]NIF62429.1 helix-turn-helix domain-containing protein [Burkholderia sp. Cy-647]NIF94327.1 helix-turn-helix domain-containing protein [Burkholderia sp. Ax-1720]
MRTLDLLECAEFLKIDRTTMLDLVNRGDIQGAKIGRAWVFLEDDVVAYLRAQVQIQTQNRIEQIHTGSPAADARADRAIRKLLSGDDRRRPGRRRRPPPELPSVGAG